MPIIQLYSNDESKTAISPLLDYQQIIPTKNKQYTTEDKKHIVAYGVGKYVVDSSTMRTLDYNNIDAFKQQLNTNNYYPLTVLTDSQGYMYSVIPNNTFATPEYVNNCINNIIFDGEVDLNGYATIQYVDDAIKDIINNQPSDKELQALTIFVYHGADTVPAKPIGGKWEKDENGQIIITYPNNWTSLNDVSTYPVYMSTSIQLENGNFISDWTDPILVSGPKGEDGESIEFKYKRTNDSSVPALPDEITINEWTDDPTGIDIKNRYEWIISRRVKGDYFGDWSTPSLWSKWGVDGKDGKDIEYIYIRTINGEPPINPTPVYINPDENIQVDPIYQTDNYYMFPWTPYPIGVGGEDSSGNIYTHEWVSVRKKIDGFWGAFSDPASWSILGEKGNDGNPGISLRTLYAKFPNTTTGADISELIVRDNINPGSIWSMVIPSYNDDEYLWSISAYVTFDNKLAEIKDLNNNTINEWQGPILVSGKGKDATPLNYNTYVYANLTNMPEIPTINNINDAKYPIDDIWLDYPKNTDSTNIEDWWQCIGLVNGVTGNISWGNVIPLNGKDGIAKDGKQYEIRMTIAKINSDGTYSYEIDRSNRNPGAQWVLANLFVLDRKLNNDECILQISGLINSNNVLEGQWSLPYRISGENGQNGSNGNSILGVDEYYSLTNNGTDIPNDWSTNIENPTEDNKYLWNYEVIRYSDGTSTETNPVIIAMYSKDGVDGLNGIDGRGISSITESYLINDGARPTENDSWGDFKQPTDDLPYLWNMETIVYSDNSTDHFINLISIKGKDGVDGKDGETGPTGGQGPIGLSGTPGTDFVIRYCLGKIGDIDDGVEDNILNVADASNYNSNGWYDDVDKIYKTVSAEWPYIYCVQGRKEYKRTDNTNEFEEVINWGTPFRLSGTNGLNGKDGSTGKNGQIIYPSGVYDVTKEYSLDDMKAPYVFDAQDGCYYVLNCKRWVGVEQDNKTPMQAGEEYWVKFEQFEAIYADIGMFRSALVGQAVFNGDYMFSQNGIDKNGNKTNHYELFNSDDPFNINNDFRPAYCVNLLTGQVWQGNGEIYFQQYGTMKGIKYDGTEDVNGYGRIGSLLIDDMGIKFLDKKNDGSYQLSTHLIGFNSDGTIYNYDDDNDYVYWRLYSNGNCEFAGGKIKFNIDGSGELAGGNISWDKDGNLSLPPTAFFKGEKSGNGWDQQYINYEYQIYSNGNINENEYEIKVGTSSNPIGENFKSIDVDKTSILPIYGKGYFNLETSYRYAILLINGKPSARLDLNEIAIFNPYNKFTIIDSGSNTGTGIDDIDSDISSEVAGNEGYWRGTYANITVTIDNSDTDTSHLFIIVPYNCEIELNDNSIVQHIDSLPSYLPYDKDEIKSNYGDNCYYALLDQMETESGDNNIYSTKCYIYTESSDSNIEIFEYR